MLLKLQKKYKDGGYVLVSPKSGKVIVFATDFKKLYEAIDRKNIDDADKLVMHVPPLHVKHVLRLFLPIQVY